VSDTPREDVEWRNVQARHEQSKALAREVFASMDGLSASTVALLASGLRFASGPLGEFAIAFGYFATDLEDGPENAPSWLSVLKLAHDLDHVVKRYGYLGELDGFIERLREQDMQPWPTLAAALEKSRALVGPSLPADRWGVRSEDDG
jgi:hypothetical protein